MGKNSKVESSKAGGDFIKGGSAHMSGKNNAGPQTAGALSAGGAKKTGKFIEGGGGKMFGKQHAGPQAPGVAQTSPGADSKFASGGSTKMFGHSGSQTAKPC